MIGNTVLMMPKTECVSLIGINEGNIETFKNTPMLSLTKEELQNSCDGRDKKSNQPVMVEFNDFYIPTSEIPDIENLIRVFREERDFWDEFAKEDKKAVEFLDNALKILSQDKVRCLRISDRNTTGLLGVNEVYSSPWNNLVVNSNVSDKAGDAGGSFGIGKNAAFASTHLRLVFYSTINLDGEKAFQGVLKLPSYKKDDKHYVGTGFYCQAGTNQKHIAESLSLDPDYTRTSVGMDKYIIGFGEDLDSETLKTSIIVSSIQNFLYSFHTGSLSVKYNDVVVDQEHLPEIIQKYSDNFDSITLSQYETLLNPDEVLPISVIDENDVKIFVKLDPDFDDRKAGIIRGNGMKVFDMSGISGRIGFSAVVVLEGKNVNAYFKKLENPEHNKWAMDRAENKKDAYEKRRKITDPLKAYITEKHRENLGTEIDSDGMGEYLPYAYTHGKSKKMEGLSNEVEKEKKKAKPKKKPSTTQTGEEVTYQEDEFGNIIESTIDINDDPTHNQGSGQSSMPSDGKKLDEDGDEEVKLSENSTGDFIIKKVVPGSNYKFKYSHNDDRYILKMSTSTTIKKGFIDVMISTETGTLPVKVINPQINGNPTKVLGGKVLIENVNENEIYDISFDLATKGDWALEVLVYES